MYNEFENTENNTQQSNPWQYGQPWPPVPEPKQKKEKKGWTAGKVIALALVCSLIGGALGTGGTLLAGGLLGSQPAQPQGGTSNMLEGQREEASIDIHKVDTNRLMTPAEVYAANVNSTVGITTAVTTNYWGYQVTSPASGSGLILSDDGYILTNYHVVEDSSAIEVALYDGTTYEAALVGYDANNDIAVLRVDATGLTPVVLGDSDKLNVGDSVVAIGNPLGELTFSLTSGAVSALNRQITIMSTGVTMNLIQTDCAINSGNSGGALFNLYGEVVGITNAKYSGDGSDGEASIDNIGFAIPLNAVRDIVTSIIEKGYISKSYIGVSVTDVSSEMQSYGLPQGAAVKTVTEGGPAQAAGLQVNDIITAANGQSISGSSDLVALVGDTAPGDILTLSVYRQGQVLTLEVTVAEQIQSANQQQEQTQGQSQQPQSQGGLDSFGSFPWSDFFGY